MIEKIIYDYLSTALSVDVYTEKPKEQPSEYVIIEKTGGSIENHIHTAMVAIQSHAESLYKAALLNEAVIEAMNEIIALDAVSMCELNSSYNYTDTTKRGYRYQAVFDLVFFG